MRAPGGLDVIKKVCEAFGKKTEEHIAEYGEGNEKRLTGQHETCSIKEFKFGVADRGASIRIPHCREDREGLHGGQATGRQLRSISCGCPYHENMRRMLGCVELFGSL